MGSEQCILFLQAGRFLGVGGLLILGEDRGGDVPGVSSSSSDLSRGQSEQLVVVVLTAHLELGSPWVLSGGILLGP